MLRMVEHADVLVEGFRPGVLERIGLGPTMCLERNPRLIYGRITGYGREGPWPPRPATTSTTSPSPAPSDPIGRRGEAPVPPLNLVADFGGGGMLLAMGILAAVYERTHSGLGQVVDAAMVDGAALLDDDVPRDPGSVSLARRAWDQLHGHRRPLLQRVRDL